MKLLILILLMYATSVSAGNYLCVADLSTGFRYDGNTKSWVVANFDVKDSKYIIAASDFSTFKYEVKKVGENLFEALCKDGFNKAGYLSCAGVVSDFRFNKNNGRYITSYTNGNVLNIKDMSSDTPYIEIGKCSEF